MGREEGGEEPRRDDPRSASDGIPEPNGGAQGGGHPEAIGSSKGNRAESAGSTPPPTFTSPEEEPDPRDGLREALGWFRRTDSEWVAFLREILVSVLIVVAVGLLLYVVSGVWPPLVAVESGSMEPHLQKGDLVLVMEEERFSPDYAAAETGVVTAQVGAKEGYYRFGGPGDVIVYQPYGKESATPIIHRARLYVEEGENWYDRANPDLIQANSCEALAACPAPTDGFITKGDNPVTNDYYDQTRGISSVVKPEWVRGTAVLRIPWLGWIRLWAADLELPGPATMGAGVTGMAIGQLAVRQSSAVA